MCVHVPRCVNEDVDDQKHSDEISDSACENEQLRATLHALTAVVSSLCTNLVLCALTLYLPRLSMLHVSCGFAHFFNPLICAVSFSTWACIYGVRKPQIWHEDCQESIVQSASVSFICLYLPLFHTSIFVSTCVLVLCAVIDTHTLLPTHASAHL